MPEVSDIKNRIMVATGGKKPDDEAMEFMVQLVQESSLADQYLENIVSHPDFVKQYSEIINAVVCADVMGVHDPKTVSRILSPDVNPSRMGEAFIAVISGADFHNIDFALNIPKIYADADINENGMNFFVRGVLSCMSHGFMDLEGENGTCKYSPEQVYFIAKLADKTETLAYIKEAEFAENTGEGHNNGEKFYLDRLFAIMNEYDCFNPKHSTEQIRAIGQCILDTVLGTYWEDWSGDLNDQQSVYVQNVCDIVLSHNAYYDIYINTMTSELYEPNVDLQEVWKHAKDAAIDNEIKDAVYPDAGLRAMCEYIGLDNETATMLQNVAKTKLGPEMKDEDIAVMADMLLENINPKDIPEYSDIIGHDYDALDNLYKLCSDNVPKEAIQECLKRGLGPDQCDEIIAAWKDGVKSNSLIEFIQDVSKVKLSEKLPGLKHIADSIPRKPKGEPARTEQSVDG